MGKYGWQQPVVMLPPKPKCPHIGLIGAAMTVYLHSEGHVWVCTCGKEFVVVSNAGKNKQLVARDERPR